VLIQQALFTTTGDRVECRASSPDFFPEWIPLAEKLCLGFGRPPDGTPCPDSVFAQPLGRKHVAVVQAAGAPAFRLLVLPLHLYAALEGDPFRIAEAFPPAWDAPGTLPALEWTAGAPPLRTVAEVRKILDVPYCPTLLGTVQALLDGGRVVFERTAPDPHLVRGLWSLLPGATRAELWPATFAYSNALAFNLIVVPRANGPEYERYVTEDQAGDYPEGRYELALQIAAEMENQHDLDRLFARRSRGQTFRLAVLLLIMFMMLPVVGFILGPQPGPPATTAPNKADSKEKPKPEKEPPP
jgi:hypothetical protein